MTNMTAYKSDEGDDDGVFCRIEDGQFRGDGDPAKLVWMIDFFRRWSDGEE